MVLYIQILLDDFILRVSTSEQSDNIQKYSILVSKRLICAHCRLQYFHPTLVTVGKTAQIIAHYYTKIVKFFFPFFTFLSICKQTGTVWYFISIMLFC